MYNARKTSKAVNNIRENDKSYSKVFESHCSCPNNFQFKSDQSRYQNKFHSNNSLGKTAKESGKCLRDEFIRYGLTPKAEKPTETKHFNSPRHVDRVDINLKNVPKDRILTVNIKENFCKNRFKSRTEPTLSTERYVEDLKREIQSNKNEIPSLPEKYKKKYLTSLKEELYLNKLTTHHDKNQEIEDIKMEIDTYRAQHSPFVPENLQISKNYSPRELKVITHSKGNKLKHRREIHKTKVRKEKKTEAGDQYGRPGAPQYADTNERHNRKKKIVNRRYEDVKTLSPSLYSEEERVEIKSPVKNYTTTSTQCEIPMTQRSDYPSDLKVTEKLEAIQGLIPKISSIIERSEKTIENAFKNVLKQKTVQDRAVSPIKDILGLDNVQENKKEISFSPKTPPNSTRDPEDEPVLNEHPMKSFTSPPKTYGPTAGDLILNIQSIKDKRSLLNGFQNELVQLKNDMEECKECKSITRNGENVNDIRNYCERHAIYIPLLKVGELGSQRDRIKLFNSLKTEAFLKNELDKQIKLIAQLEKKLSKARRNNNSDKLESLEKQLVLAKSYFDNLLVKQQTERVLNEQQKIIEDSAGHECVNIEDCEKCCLERQVHELLGRVRGNIAMDIEDSKQRLTIHKMPIIDIRKPLQLQNILKMNIPPCSPPQTSPKTNIVFEAVVKDDGIDDSCQNQAMHTKILVNKTTSVELSSYKRKKESNITRDEEHNKQQNVAKSGKSEDSTLINTSPKSSVKPMSFAKTPSELGFRRNVASQCDSTSSLMESIDRAPKMTTQAQTGVEREESCYLFGFKEYLMKESRASPIEHVDDMLQESLDGSIDTVFKSTSTTTADSQSSINRRLSKAKSSEFQETSVVPPGYDKIDKEQQTLRPSSVSAEDEFNDKGSQFGSLQKISSLKEMLLPSFSFPESQQRKLDVSIQTSFTESKYRLKKFSFNRPESDIEVKRDSGGAFYKSLTDKEDLPDRKSQTLIGSHLSIANVSDVHETTTQSSYLEQSGATKHTDDQNLKHPSSILNVRGFTFKKKPSTREEPESNRIPDYNNLTNLSLIEKDTTKSRDDDKHTELKSPNLDDRRSTIEKRPSFKTESEHIIITDDIDLENLNLIQRDAIKSKDDDTHTDNSSTSRNESRPSFKVEPEIKRATDENNLKNFSLIRKDDTKSRDHDKRSTVEKRPSFKTEAEYITITDDIDLNRIQKDIIKSKEKHKDVSATSRNVSRPTFEKKLSFEPEVKRITDENNLQNLSSIQQDAMRSKNDDKNRQLTATTIQNELEPKLFTDGAEARNNDQDAKIRRSSISGEKLNETKEDPEISKNDSEETETHFGNTKPIKETATTDHSQNTNHQETAMSDSYEAYFETSGHSKLQSKMVDGKSEIDETKNEPAEKINYSTEEKLETNDDDVAGFLEDISIQDRKKQEQSNAQTEILEVLPPTYELVVNKNDFHSKLPEKNVSPHDLESSKPTKIIEISPLSNEKSGEEPGRRYRETKNNISDFFDTDKFVISCSPHSKYKTNIANYILPVEHNKQTLIGRPCSCKFCSELPRIAQDRLEYSERCSNIDKSVESTLVSSEGEVIANISVGEIRHCPRRKDNSKKIHSVINYKEKLSSHLLLEKERKHYNHWVTYYTTKKYKNESSSSSSQSHKINDN